MALTQRQKISAIKAALETSKTLAEIIGEMSSGGMGGITGGKGKKETIDITDEDLNLMLKNMGFIKNLQKQASKGKTKVAERDKKKYDDYTELKKAAKKSLPSKSGAINPNNLKQLKKVLDSQAPQPKKKK